MEVTIYKMKGDKAIDAVAKYAVQKVLFDGILGSENFSKPLITNIDALDNERQKTLRHLATQEYATFTPCLSILGKDKKMKASRVEVTVNVAQLSRVLQNNNFRRKFGVN